MLKFNATQMKKQEDYDHGAHFMTNKILGSTKDQTCSTQSMKKLNCLSSTQFTKRKISDQTKNLNLIYKCKEIDGQYCFLINISISKGRIIILKGEIVHKLTYQSLVIPLKEASLSLRILTSKAEINQSSYSFFYQYEQQTIKYSQKRVLFKNLEKNNNSYKIIIQSLISNTQIAIFRIKCMLQILGVKKSKIVKIIQLKNNLIRKIKNIVKKQYQQSTETKHCLIQKEKISNYKVLEIVNIKAQKQVNRSNSKKGGFFQICFAENVSIECKPCRKFYQFSDNYYESLQNSQFTGKFAIKVYNPKDKSKISPEQEIKKIHHQLKIVSLIKNPKYIISYFVHQENLKKIQNRMPEQFSSPENSNQSGQTCKQKFQDDTIIPEAVQNKNKNSYLTDSIPLYLQYYEYTLNDVIYYNDLMSLQDNFLFSLQLISAVQSLHQSNIVHRDLKPTNILVGKSMELKVIDFGQSYCTDKSLHGKFFQISKGSTIPYSSFQSSVYKNDEPNQRNDYWSCGINIFEIFNKKLPVYYSKTFQADIRYGWEQQFILSIDMIQKHGIRLVYDIINYLACMMIRIKQDQRLNLKQAKLIMQQSYKYIEQLCKLAK